MNRNVKKIVLSGLIAAMYVVLTLLQNTLFPGTASAAVQFRASEALCVLAIFTPAAIPGLTVGCIISNIFAGLGAIDLVVGPLASFLAALGMYLLRNQRALKLPILSLLCPAVSNGLLVGGEIAFFFSEGAAFWAVFWMNAGLVAVGELAVLFTLGVFLFLAVEKNSKLKEYIAG